MTGQGIRRRLWQSQNLLHNLLFQYLEKYLNIAIEEGDRVEEEKAYRNLGNA